MHPSGVGTGNTSLSGRVHMFYPIFPMAIAAHAPRRPIAPLIWLGGVVCLWLTRYTHSLGARWGKGYYLLSAIIRPAGVLLIGLGWAALYSPAPAPLTLGWLPNQSWTGGLCWTAILAFFARGFWSVAILGFRRSFLYRNTGGSLVVTGPYRPVRHPQFLSAIGITSFTMRLFNPCRFEPSSPFTCTRWTPIGPFSAWRCWKTARWLPTSAKSTGITLRPRRASSPTGEARGAGGCLL